MQNAEWNGEESVKGGICIFWGTSGGCIPPWVSGLEGRVRGAEWLSTVRRPSGLLSCRASGDELQCFRPLQTDPAES